MKPKNFFHSTAYRNWLRCRIAFLNNPTDNNLDLLITWAIRAMDLCDTEYKSIGLNKDTNKYSWFKKADHIYSRDDLEGEVLIFYKINTSLGTR